MPLGWFMALQICWDPWFEDEYVVKESLARVSECRSACVHNLFLWMSGHCWRPHKSSVAGLRSWSAQLACWHWSTLEFLPLWWKCMEGWLKMTKALGSSNLEISFIAVYSHMAPCACCGMKRPQDLAESVRDITGWRNNSKYQKYIEEHCVCAI